MKDTRIEFRSSPQEKDILKLAAGMMGINFSAFLRDVALKAANEVIHSSEELRLSNRDRDLFLDALEKPPAPLPTLKKAMEKYRSANRADPKR